MRPAPLAAASLLLVVACHGHRDRQAAEAKDDAVHISAADAGSGHVSVSIPGFGAKVSLPDMDLGKHLDLNGIALAPGTSVHGVDVDSHDGGGGPDAGQVRIGFSSSQSADALMKWYGDQVAKAGYVGATAGNGSLNARKGAKRFALAVSPAPGGSAGTIVMRGED